MHNLDHIQLVADAKVNHAGKDFHLEPSAGFAFETTSISGIPKTSTFVEMRPTSVLVTFRHHLLVPSFLGYYYRLALIYIFQILKLIEYCISK